LQDGHAVVKEQKKRSCRGKPDEEHGKRDLKDDASEDSADRDIPAVRAKAPSHEQKGRQAKQSVGYRHVNSLLGFAGSYRMPRGIPPLIT
jgi:hypothetical protein